ncbi:MAG TPA: glycosyl hydrolase [Bacteroidales bacterium]|nr:glycosyl hydrolase [Bacteroidales bacterium]
MNYLRFISLTFCFPFMMLSCNRAPEVNIVDKGATEQTKNLYAHLKALSNDHILFGQQGALTQGYGWWRHHDSTSTSDLYEVSGHYPALYGYDFGRVQKRYLDMERKVILQSYHRGGVITFSQHMQNPASGKGPRDTTLNLDDILPGGYAHKNFTDILDKVGSFAKSLKTPDGTLIPVIYRPFHEHTGNWFWWGEAFNTPDQFVSLWRFTVHYLRDSLNVHNFLYAYSPDTVESVAHYLERYPGDDYVDVLGIDIYRDVESNNLPAYLKRIRMVVNLAEKKNKIAALTETGYSRHDITDWWTAFLGQVAKDPVAKKISYLMLWANYHDDQYYSIYPGNASEPDFLEMIRDSTFLFEDELPDMYAPVK